MSRYIRKNTRTSQLDHHHLYPVWTSNFPWVPGRPFAALLNTTLLEDRTTGREWAPMIDPAASEPPWSIEKRSTSTCQHAIEKSGRNQCRAYVRRSSCQHAIRGACAHSLTPGRADTTTNSVRPRPRAVYPGFPVCGAIDAIMSRPRTDKFLPSRRQIDHRARAAVAENTPADAGNARARAQANSTCRCARSIDRQCDRVTVRGGGRCTARTTWWRWWSSLPLTRAQTDRVQWARASKSHPHRRGRKVVCFEAVGLGFLVGFSLISFVRPPDKPDLRPPFAGNSTDLSTKHPSIHIHIMHINVVIYAFRCQWGLLDLSFSRRRPHENFLVENW